MKRPLVMIGAAVAALGLLAGCSTTNSGSSSSGSTTLDFAALQGGYGTAMYHKVIDAYEKLHPNVHIKLTLSKDIEDEITPQMKAGNYPDLVELGEGRAAGLTETMVKDKALEDLTPVLKEKIPGQGGTVSSQLTGGIVGNLATNPYGTDKTYLMPVYYAPTGLVYDKHLFAEKGWAVPTTWKQMFQLGDEAKAQGMSLFTYPTTGYLDSFFYALTADVGGKAFYDDVMNYKPGIWETAKGKKVLDIATKLLSYAAPTTVGYANEQDYLKNQQSVMDDKALFMPNGTWVSTEMASAPRASGFEWGLMPLPAVSAGDERYIATQTEAVWVPSAAKHKDAAKDFIAFMYSKKAAKLFAASGAIQPIKGVSSLLTGDNKSFYKVYDESGVKPIVGGFASTGTVQGVSIQDTLFGTANSIITGDKTEAQWRSALNAASNKLHAAKD
ncbi:carbohydrate ABC transporter substrate-binding protein [Curtobacterium sp. MCBD17_040]|uniref:carbohydrate ABC transporter substrate-binding protein n=1 Tax=Curtobacterium sp. MCBD17_040 TaxID=2175674 RepID=UPI000DA745FB|nr:carbohydrate ABC transporter substrate-binding protein [Curtobacterium sp. MCBD17_040]WIB62972.1 carbohydrate ABC transporter substrate-binding protein [Curtobacterium sp. MCBD17_040]